MEKHNYAFGRRMSKKNPEKKVIVFSDRKRMCYIPFILLGILWHPPGRIGRKRNILFPVIFIYAFFIYETLYLTTCMHNKILRNS